MCNQELIAGIQLMAAILAVVGGVMALKKRNHGSDDNNGGNGTAVIAFPIIRIRAA